MENEAVASLKVMCRFQIADRKKKKSPKEETEGKNKDRTGGISVAQGTAGKKASLAGAVGVEFGGSRMLLLNFGFHSVITGKILKVF